MTDTWTRHRHDPYLALPTLRLLAAVEDLGSLGAAARALSMTQPNASRTIASLERHLGFDLLRRSPRGSTLTAEGLAVSAQARLVLAAQDRLGSTVETLAQLRTKGPIRLELAASRTIGEHLVPRWLGAQARTAPDTWVSFRFDNSMNVERWVREGQVPLGFVEAPLGAGERSAEDDVVSMTLAMDALTVIVPPNHPWAEHGVDHDALATTHLVEREPGSGTRATLDLALPDRAAALTVLDSNAAILAAVAAGVAPAVLSSLAVERSVADGSVALAAWRGPILQRPLRALWRRDRPLPDAVAGFLRLAVADADGAASMV